MRRPLHGQYEKHCEELKIEDSHSFKNFLRVDANIFRDVLGRAESRIETQDTFWRKPLSPGLRLAITLRYLATGDSYKGLSYGFRVAHNTISQIIPETCEAIIAEYLEDVLRCPTTPGE